MIAIVNVTLDHSFSGNEVRRPMQPFPPPPPPPRPVHFSSRLHGSSLIEDPTYENLLPRSTSEPVERSNPTSIDAAVQCTPEDLQVVQTRMKTVDDSPPRTSISSPAADAERPPTVFRRSSLQAEHSESSVLGLSPSFPPLYTCTTKFP